MRVLDRLWTRQLALVDLGHYLRGSTCPLAFSQLLSSPISVPVVRPLSTKFIIHNFIPILSLCHPFTHTFHHLPSLSTPIPVKSSKCLEEQHCKLLQYVWVQPSQKKAFCELDHQKVILSNVWELLADIILCLSYSLQSFLHCCSSSLLYVLLSFLCVPFSIRHHHIQE